MYCLSIVSSLTFIVSTLNGVRDTTMFMFSLITCLVATYSLLSRHSEIIDVDDIPDKEGYTLKEDI